MERLVLLDEDEDVEGAEGATVRLLKRRRRQEASTTVKVSLEGIQSAELSQAPMVDIKVGGSSRDVASSSLRKGVELVVASIGGESGVRCLRALIILFGALSAKLEIPCC